MAQHYQHTAALPRHSEGNDDSDVEFVSYEAGMQTQFNPLSPAVAQFLCKKVEEQRSGTATCGLGAPCKITDTVGDGNCFFRAISKALCGSDELHLTIRRAVVTQLETYAPAYENILRSDYKSVSEYIRKSDIRSQGSWATEVEIQAAADFFDVSIYTFYEGCWIQYIPKGGRVSDQGIYLENCGYHYKNVVCVKRPEMQSCYNYCRPDSRGDSGTFSPYPPESAAHAGLVEENCDHFEEEVFPYGMDEEDWAFDGYRGKEEDYEMDGDRSEEEDEIDENLSEEEDEMDENLSEEEDETDENLSEEEDDDESQGVLPENKKLSWSAVNTSWGIFLEYLGERWWCLGSEDEIRSFMDNPERRPGDIVVSAPLSNTPGAVCSITLKTANSTPTTDVAIRGEFYTCTKLIEGEFSDLTKVIRYLVREMELKNVRLQPRPGTMPCNAQEFSGMHVAEELSLMMTTDTSRIFWGSYECAESPRYHDMLRRCALRKQKLGDSTKRLCVVTRCRSDHSLGYLFEVLSDQGEKFRVTFDRHGFAIGSASRFHKICDLLSYLNENERVLFLGVPRTWDAET